MRRDGRVRRRLGARFCAVGATLYVSTAWAGPNFRDQARAALSQVEATVAAGAADDELSAPFVAEAERALLRAQAPAVAPSTARREAAWELAFEWARAALDLLLARNAETRADELELELTSLQTELVRSRAAVEQARARLGRARAAFGGLGSASVQTEATAETARPEVKRP